MRLATIRHGGGTRAVRIEGDRLVGLDAADVGQVLADPGWRTSAAGGGEPLETGLDDADFAPLVVHPEKVICVGLNYKDHILEMGRQLPDHPTLFPKFARTLIGAYDDITLPAASEKVDWEAELCVVIGQQVRNAQGQAARDAIAGFTVLNDVSMRDWQNHTTQFMAGKIWEASTPVGPALVTTEEADPGFAFDISCTVDGQTMQSSNTGQLLFHPVRLVEYLSTIITLMPGDLIATGTPGGVGHGRKPPVYLRPGQTVVTTVAGIGECRNHCVAEKVAS